MVGVCVGVGRVPVVGATPSFLPAASSLETTRSVRAVVCRGPYLSPPPLSQGAVPAAIDVRPSESSGWPGRSGPAGSAAPSGRRCGSPSIRVVGPAGLGRRGAVKRGSSRRSGSPSVLRRPAGPQGPAERRQAGRQAGTHTDARTHARAHARTYKHAREQRERSSRQRKLRLVGLFQGRA
jgi:hypothetical protein